jgi:large subunit ribosomal protein L21
MYAVFRSGGKQYRASMGDRLKLEKLDADEGATLRFEEVLLVGEGADIKVGSPLVAGGAVDATVVKQGKSGKVSVTKFRRRQNYLRQHTHRQFFTEIEITGISGATAKPRSESAEKADEAKAPAKKKKVAKKAAAKKAAGKKTSKKKAAAGTASKKKARKKSS